MVRQPRRLSRYRIRGEDSKKLRSAFARRIADDEGVLPVDDWIAAVAEENPNEAWLQQLAREDDAIAEWHDWYDIYFRAFQALRYDRFYGAMGGEGPISYLALSQYARDRGIAGDDFAQFCTFVSAIDAEWLAYVTRKSKKVTSAQGQS